MGIIDKLGRGRIHDRCDKNPDSGEVICRRVRANKDGTEVEVAGFTMVADASCNPIITSNFENEDGALEELEKKFARKIVAKCKNKPADF